MKKFIDSWTKQSGVPIVTVTKTADGRHRFLQMPAKDSCLSLSDQGLNQSSMKDFREGSMSGSRVRRNQSGHQPIWSIPLTYKTSKGARGMFWLTTRQHEMLFPGNPEWVLFNTDNKGYYVVNYTNEVWNWLLETLENSRRFDPQDYVRLLFDSYYLAKLRCIDHSIYLKILKLVKGNPSLSHIDWTCFPETLNNFRRN